MILIGHHNVVFSVAFSVTLLNFKIFLLYTCHYVNLLTAVLSYR